VIDGAALRTVMSQGVQLAVVEAGDPAQPTILFVHGYPDTHALWDGVLERLAPRFHVVAYDVRGAGASSAPRGPAAYDLQRLADDFAAVSAAVAQDQPVHLVGHDWGGIQGWEFATSPRFAGMLASFTTIAGPSLDQVIGTGHALVRRGRLLRALRRARRSWYVVALCLPGGPTLAWRVLMAGGRWRRSLQTLERLPVDDRFPAPTLTADGLHGSNLYRRNIPRRILRPRRAAPAHVPVQLIVPTGDRFIGEDYYERAARCAPQLRRRTIAGSHWAPRSQPELIARWVGEHVDDVHSGAAGLSS
jgi:pimeloyl-ACP methyl ester carboxylesterase